MKILRPTGAFRLGSRFWSGDAATQGKTGKYGSWLRRQLGYPCTTMIDIYV